jgi:hypothetical protein
MTARPDYSTAREEAGFGWSVGSAQGALRELTGTPIRDFNLDPDACIAAYRRGRPLIREMFGEDVSIVGLATPAVSYGHANVLGCELLFPEGGEVAHTHIYASLEEGLRRLREPVDYFKAGMAPFYLDFRERMRQAFPGEPVGLSFGAEGPMTTAYELRGEGFFTDVLDDLPLAQRFMEAVVASILDYHRWLCSVDGRPALNPDAGAMCDDIASFLPPRLFPQLVVPSWEGYFAGITTGRRHAHVEDLRVDQLPFLEDIGLAYYDPSISPRLDPRLIFENCRVPFAWHLESFHIREMSLRDVEDFVYQSVADGASGVTMSVAETMCNDDGAAKVAAFIGAAKEAKRLFDDGTPRDEIGRRVSPDGQRKLWGAWCGSLSPRSTRGGMKRCCQGM